MAWMAAWFEGAQHSRAERHLRSTEIAAAAHAGGEPEVVTLRKLLEGAQAALAADKVEECWHLLNGARRILAGLAKEDDRRDSGRVLLIEAYKISAWRRKSIEKILGDDSVTPTPSALVAALLLRDEYYENRYHRIDMQREQMKTLVVITAGALLVTLGIATTADLSNLGIWEWRSLALILMFGILGASFSAAQSTSAKALTTLIPELAQSKSIALTRTILGACPGLAAYAFLHSGMLNLGDVNMAKSLAVAFVGGFSERLVVKMVETVAGKEAPAK